MCRDSQSHVLTFHHMPQSHAHALTFHQANLRVAKQYSSHEIQMIIHAEKMEPFLCSRKLLWLHTHLD